MKRFLTIKNNKIVGERFAAEIVDGEIESTQEHDGVELGMVLVDGIWQVDPQDIINEQKQNRIIELKETIENKGYYLGEDVTAEREELKQLLGL